MITMNYLVQVPADWRPTSEWALMRLPNGDFDWTSTPITYGDHTPVATDAPPPPLPLGPEFPDKKWSNVELMPVPDSMFPFIWDYLVWHMSATRAGTDEGILMVRHDGRNIFMRVARHRGLLIIIQRQLA